MPVPPGLYFPKAESLRHRIVLTVGHTGGGACEMVDSRVRGGYTIRSRLLHGTRRGVRKGVGYG